MFCSHRKLNNDVAGEFRIPSDVFAGKCPGIDDFGIGINPDVGRNIGNRKKEFVVCPDKIHFLTGSGFEAYGLDVETGITHFLYPAGDMCVKIAVHDLVNKIFAFKINVHGIGQEPASAVNGFSVVQIKTGNGLICVQRLGQL